MTENRAGEADEHAIVTLRCHIPLYTRHLLSDFYTALFYLGLFKIKTINIELYVQTDTK